MSIKMPRFDDDVLTVKGFQNMGPSLESKFEELKYEIVSKIDKELGDSQNARDYIAQKFDEMCRKIQYLSSLDATVTGFRSDVAAIERQLRELRGRIDAMEKRSLARECPSVTSSTITRVIPSPPPLYPGDTITSSTIPG